MRLKLIYATLVLATVSPVLYLLSTSPQRIFRVGKTTVTFQQVSVINLSFRPKRWTKIKSLLQLHGFQKIVRFNAIEGKRKNLLDMYHKRQLDRVAYRSVLAARPVGGHFMTIGGLGCYLSHIALWKQAMKQDEPMIIIEDDVFFINDFDPLFHAALKELPPTFDLFYFSSLVRTEAVKNATIPFSRHLDRVLGEQWGLYAYMISPAAAKRLYHYVYPIQIQLDSFLINMIQSLELEVFRSTTNLVLTDNQANRLSDVQMTKARVQALKFHIPWLIHVQNHTTVPVVLQTGLRGINSVDIKRWNETNVTLAYQLQKLYDYGGYYFDSELNPRVELDRILNGLRGILGYRYVKGKVFFPMLGFSKGHPMLPEMIQESREFENKELVEKWKLKFTTVHASKATVLVPVDVLVNSTSSAKLY